MQTASEAGLALHHYLIEKQLVLATAESCTGGLVAALLTEHPGSSAYLDRGFVTYSNESKQEMLGVSGDVLAKNGAVSESTAADMAKGAAENSAADISLAITGIAGPDGGTPSKPVGTVCFGWRLPNAQIVTDTRHFEGGRSDVREQAAAYSLQHLLTLIRGS